ncbi:unnamed protein product [Rotaria magnacalcarata]|nr:unnamed protein product [Rotaria magnacalcarata]
MIVSTMIFLLFGTVKYASSIHCYECVEPDGYCPLPLNLDPGDESNENNIATSEYDNDYACMSDHLLKVLTEEETIILRGEKNCQELNEPNHRVYCCFTDYCNKILPPMISKSLADLMPFDESRKSNNLHYVPSTILIVLNIIIFSLFFLH